MATDRTWYNGLYDDSGSGLDGYIWKKADVGQVLTEVDKTQVGCVVTYSGGGLVPPGAAVAAIQFNAEVWDPYGMWSPGLPASIVVPYAGLYLVTGFVTWNPGPAGVGSRGTVLQNASGSWLQFPATNAAPAASFYQTISVVVHVFLGAGEQIQLAVSHDAGTNLQLGLCRLTVGRCS